MFCLKYRIIVLVYFHEGINQTILPRIKINGDNTISPAKETLIVSNTQYSKSNTETTKIQPEILREQILYKDSETENPKLDTFIYVYMLCVNTWYKCYRY